MKGRRTAAVVAAIFVVSVFVVGGWGTSAELYFSADKNGENRVTKIREGDQIWIVVHDPDEDIDCDVRDKVWTDIKVMDTKTGAHIVWKSYLDAGGVDTNGDDIGDTLWGQVGFVPYKGHWPGPRGGWLGEDYLEETDRGTGLFVSSRPFRIGTRVAFSDDGVDHGHIVGPYRQQAGWVDPTDFHWGGFLYADDPLDPATFGDDRVWVAPGGAFVLATTGAEVPNGNAYLPPGGVPAPAGSYMLGRFENMDTLAGLYVDPNDASDVGLGSAKIDDVEATIGWGREVYRDANESAMITVVDPDENLDCSKVETVPVFIVVNPGSWNPVRPNSPTSFCMLKQLGGVVDIAGSVPDPSQPILWYNIYRNVDYVANVEVFIDLAADGSGQPNVAGTYYIEYPTAADLNVTAFDTASATGITRVMFYARETGADTGVFQLNLNSILRDLGFLSLNVRDVLVAYYMDPNDQDDFKLATAYIGERNHSRLRFTDYARNDEETFWIGRDPVYVEVVDRNANTDACCPEAVVVHVCDPHEVDDAEWLLLDELSSNSPTFFTHVGMRLNSVWDALGVGEAGARGGYSLQLDNWVLEAFNEDSIYARYNDVVYVNGALPLIGDLDTTTAFPPAIAEVRVGNDVSFAVLEVGDTQVFDGEETAMHFLDRQGNRVSGYMNSDCVFVEVVDPDQDEDRNRRERIVGFWDGTGGAGQNLPFGPANSPANHAACGYEDVDLHPVNALLGDTEIFDQGEWAKIYVLNPRNGRWAAVDLLETGINSGVFVSVTCVDLVSQYPCAPSLGALPGDTLLAVYHDPSNHSDVAWIAIKVGYGGAVVTGSTTSFVDSEGDDVAAYVAGDTIYVKVVDPSLADAGTIAEAVTIDGTEYDLAPLPGGARGTFITAGLDLGYGVGETVTATYVDPSDPNDTSFDTVTIVAAELRVERFFSAPNPFAEEVTFGYLGDGLAEELSVAVYDLAGHRIWTGEEHDALTIRWDGQTSRGERLANGAYIYVLVATGNGETFAGKGTLFILR